MGCHWVGNFLSFWWKRTIVLVSTSRNKNIDITFGVDSNDLPHTMQPSDSTPQKTPYCLLFCVIAIFCEYAQQQRNKRKYQLVPEFHSNDTLSNVIGGERPLWDHTQPHPRSLHIPSWGLASWWCGSHQFLRAGPWKGWKYITIKQLLFATYPSFRCRLNIVLIRHWDPGWFLTGSTLPRASEPRSWSPASCSLPLRVGRVAN